MIDETIRRGRALATGAKGRHGGDTFEFSKTFILQKEGRRRSKTVVAVCEVVGKVCHVVTVFNE